MSKIDIIKRRLHRELRARQTAESIIESKSLELYNAHNRLINYSERLKQSNNDLEHFAHTVSHDLKSPLSRIKGLFGLLKNDNHQLTTQEKEEYLSLVDQQIQNMEELINEVLKYSQLRTHELTVHSVVNLNEIIDELINEIPQANFFKINKKRLPNLKGNQTQIKQIFQNLIGNAVKYHDQDQGEITIDYQEFGQYFQIWVKDDGPGIPKSDHEKIFELFGTSAHHKKVDSTGIGLATVKKIVTQNEGKVWLESEIGLGSTFFIQWPK